MNSTGLSVNLIIPTYNRASVLDRAIESALDQTYEHIEVIVVDDGSTDDTESVVGAFDDDRLRYVYQENAGANAARNRGIRLASGRYVSFLDSDDELHPEHVERVVKTLEAADNDVVGAFTNARHLSKGSLVETMNVPGRTVSFEDLRRENVIGGFSATTFERRVFEEIGYLDEELASSQDYDLYLRVTKRYRLEGIPEPLVDIHLDGDRISDDIDRKIEGQDRLLEKHGDDLAPERIAHHHYVRGLIHGSNGDLRAARTAFRSALRHHPYAPLSVIHYVATFSGRYGYPMLMSLKKKVKSFQSRMIK